MIAMQLAEVPAKGTSGPTYTATAVWNGTTHTVTSRSEPSCKLARLLVELGCPDGPWEAWQGGTRAMSGRSLHRWAGLTVAEGDREGPRFVKFTAYPDSAHAVSAQPEASPAASAGADGACGVGSPARRPGAARSQRTGRTP